MTMTRTAGLIALALTVLGSAATAAAAPAAGSLLVRVFSDDRLPLAGARIEAVPAPVRAKPDAPPQAPVVLAQATSDGKGWATLEKLPPGAVVLQVMPDGRKQPWISDPIEIREGERSVVDDIIVPSPSELVVHLELSDSVREHLSAGRIDGIRISASAPRAKTLHADTTEAAVRFDEVLPGKWMIRAMLLLGGKTYALEPRRGIEVEVPPGTRIDQTIPVSALVFAGRVTFRGEPLQGQMTLMPVELRLQGSTFKIPLADEGRFAFPLPHAGKWDVRATSVDGKIATVPAFEFREADAGDEIVIELPEGAIAGKVVDVRGKAVPGASVSAVQRRDVKERTILAVATSGESGDFTLDALTEGTWRISASHAKASSESQQISLAEDARIDGILIRLTRQKRQIRVVSPAGEPVRRARITVSALSPERRISSRVLVTDAEGVTAVDLDVSDGAPISIVFESGPAVLTFLHPAADEMTITVQPPDATLRFTQLELRDRRVLVREDGSFFPLEEWQGRFEYLRTKQPVEARVRSGTWQIVVVDTPREREQLYLGLGFSLPAERRFHVAPGATVQIE